MPASLRETGSQAFSLWVAEQVGTRVRMPLGAKSRRRRRPSADAGGHSHPRAFAPGAQPFAGACFSFSREKRIQQPTTQPVAPARRSEEHTPELQSLMRNSYAVFCLKKKSQYPRTWRRASVADRG